MKKTIKILYILQIFLLIQLFILAFLYFRDYTRIIYYDLIFTTIYSLGFIIFMLFQKIKVIKRLIPVVIVTCYSLFVYYNLELILIGGYWRFILENKQELTKWIASNDVNHPPKIDKTEFVNINDSTYFICLRSVGVSCEGIAYSYKEGNDMASMSIFFIESDWIHIFGNWYYWSGYNEY